MRTNLAITRKTKLAQAIALTLTALAANQAQAIDYSFSTLTPGVLGSDNHYVNNINNLGQVTANVNDVWDGANWITVPNPAGSDTNYLNAINDSGMVGGYSHPAGVDRFLPQVWNSPTSTPTELPDLGLPNPWATGVWSINNSGQMTGVNYEANANGIFFHPVTWTPDGVIHDLPTLGGDGGTLWSGHNINNAGVIAGAASLANGDGSHAAAWVDFAVHDLGTLGGTNSGAFGINSPGQIVGGADLANDTTHPVLWTNYTSSSPIDLGTLGGASGIARNINDQGAIVGFSDTADGSSHPTLWNNGQIIDLLQYFPSSVIAAGWLPEAGGYSYLGPTFIGINNSGTILGNMCTATACTAYELTAVPLPGAVWLFGSALAGFIGMKRRKNSLAV